jgi:hypothetical protein
MRYAIIVLGIIAVLGHPNSGEGAEGITGNLVHQSCSTSNDEYCIGYATGVRDTAAIYEFIVKPPPRRLCVPQVVTADQLKDIFSRYLNSHPEKRHNAAVVLAFWAYQEAFPCGR